MNNTHVCFLSSSIIKAVKVSLLSIIILFFWNCKSTEQVTYRPFIKNNFDSVDSPARFTRASEAYLKRAGYIKIGQITISHTHKECFSKCETFKHKYSTIKHIALEAAKRGGHLVRPVIKNRYLSGKTKVRGECAYWSYKVEYVSRFVNAPVGSGRVGQTVRVRETKRVCDRYNYIHGRKYYFLTKGYVWRKIRN